MAGNCLSYKEVHIEGWWTNSNTVQDNDSVGDKERLMGVPASGAKVEDNSLISKLECEPRQKWVTFLENPAKDSIPLAILISFTQLCIYCETVFSLSDPSEHIRKAIVCTARV
jgi:hypothetical protein